MSIEGEREPVPTNRAFGFALVHETATMSAHSLALEERDPGGPRHGEVVAESGRAFRVVPAKYRVRIGDSGTADVKQGPGRYGSLCCHEDQ
jgi:hypothetical protein